VELTFLQATITCAQLIGKPLTLVLNVFFLFEGINVKLVLIIFCFKLFVNVFVFNFCFKSEKGE
jgi:hypothetical protein